MPRFLKILCIQHLSIEGPDAIEAWAHKKSHSFKKIIMEKGNRFPSINSFDWLVIMGGSMGVHDEEEFSWLVAEKKFIKKAIDAHKIVLGICLGAQLIAEVLGGKVCKNKFSEIGFFPIELSKSSQPLLNLRGGGGSYPLVVFHWHNDTFTLPPKAKLLASSKATKNQAFIYGDKVVGLQFHPEVFLRTIHKWTKVFDVLPGPYVQSQKEILKNKKNTKQAQVFLNSFLNQLEKLLDNVVTST